MCLENECMTPPGQEHVKVVTFIVIPGNSLKDLKIGVCRLTLSALRRVGLMWAAPWKKLLHISKRMLVALTSHYSRDGKMGNKIGRTWVIECRG